MCGAGLRQRLVWGLASLFLLGLAWLGYSQLRLPGLTTQQCDPGPVLGLPQLAPDWVSHQAGYTVFPDIFPSHHPTVSILGVVSYNSSDPDALSAVVTVSFRDAVGAVMPVSQVGKAILTARFEAFESGSGSEPVIVFEAMLLLAADGTYSATVPLPTHIGNHVYNITVLHGQQSRPCREDTAQGGHRCVVVDCVAGCPWDAWVLNDPAFSLSDARGMGTSFPVPVTPSELAVSSPARPRRWSSLPLCVDGDAPGHWYFRELVCAADPELPQCASRADVAFLDGPYLWLPSSCRYHNFQPSEAVACLRKYSRLVLFGDSLLRSTHEYLTEFLKLPDHPEPYTAERSRNHAVMEDNLHGYDIYFRMNMGLATLDWLAPYAWYKGFASLPEGETKTQVLLVQPSRWEFYMPGHLYGTSLRRLLLELSRAVPAKIVFVWPEPSRMLGVQDDWVFQHATAMVLSEPAVREAVYRVVNTFPTQLPFRYESEDGVHYQGLLERMKVNTVLNVVCGIPAQ